MSPGVAGWTGKVPGSVLEADGAGYAAACSGVIRCATRSSSKARAICRSSILSAIRSLMISSSWPTASRASLRVRSTSNRSAIPAAVLRAAASASLTESPMIWSSTMVLSSSGWPTGRRLSTPNARAPRPSMARPTTRFPVCSGRFEAATPRELATLDRLAERIESDMNGLVGTPLALLVGHWRLMMDESGHWRTHRPSPSSTRRPRSGVAESTNSC